MHVFVLFHSKPCLHCVEVDAIIAVRGVDCLALWVKHTSSTASRELVVVWGLSYRHYEVPSTAPGPSWIRCYFHTTSHLISPAIVWAYGGEKIGNCFFPTVGRANLLWLTSTWGLAFLGSLHPVLGFFLSWLIVTTVVSCVFTKISYVAATGSIRGRRTMQPIPNAPFLQWSNGSYQERNLVKQLYNILSCID